jgi:putative alpha-1,2-mannosidase
MRSILGFITVLLVSCFWVNSFGQELTKYVDPNIGTAHSRWFFYTPAAVPFGMAKLAPSTNAHYGNEQGWEPLVTTTATVQLKALQIFMSFR